MKTFSKLGKDVNKNEKNQEVLWKNDYLEIKKDLKDDWTYIKESDFSACIIYLVEYNQFILRYEYIPTFRLRDGNDFSVTVVSGTIEDGETPEQTIIREIEEEAGIVLRPDFVIEMDKPLFISKGHMSKFHPCLVVLNESDYHEVVAKGDGSKAEKLSKAIKIDVKYINNINTSDMITSLLIEKLKRYLNL